MPIRRGICYIVHVIRKKVEVTAFLFRRVLDISCTEHVTNEELLATITKGVKHYEEKKRTLRWYRHVTGDWTIKAHPPRYRSRWKNKGNTEKEMDGQHR